MTINLIPGTGPSRLVVNTITMWVYIIYIYIHTHNAVLLFKCMITVKRELFRRLNVWEGPIKCIG